jgi:bifunctional DNA-binding transcriptional regulator/antitoxin component of YhaV-PrlF toxin-antitoxin module
MRKRVVRSDGSVTLPRELRERAKLVAGTRVEIIQADGGLLITPAAETDPERAWYWTEEWQRGEREADEDVRLGRSRVYESGEAFATHLREIHNELVAQGR